MIQRRTLLAAAFAAALVPSAPGQSPSPAPAAPGAAQPVDAAARAKAPIVVGVVDIDKAIDLYPKAIAERERIQTLQKKFADELDGMQKDIDQARAELATYKEGSDAREWFANSVLPERLKRKDARRQFLQGVLDRERARYALAMYQDAEIAIREVAKAKGVQLVLRTAQIVDDQDLPKSGDAALEAKYRSYDRRQVWFASEEIDLTPAVIKFLQVPIEAPKDAAGKTGDGKPADGKAGTAGKNAEPGANKTGGGL